MCRTSLWGKQPWQSCLMQHLSSQAVWHKWLHWIKSSGQFLRMFSSKTAIYLYVNQINIRKLYKFFIKNTNNDSDSKASHICRSAISLHWKRLVLHEDIYCTWWWYTIFKWMRHSTSTIVKGFKAKSLDAVCQSILTFKFNALLPREFTCIHQKQHCVSAFAY